MQLRKCCNHPYLMRNLDDWIDDPEKSQLKCVSACCFLFAFLTAVYLDQLELCLDTLFRNVVQASGKMILVDKMLSWLKERGHRVLIYFQVGLRFRANTCALCVSSRLIYATVNR